MRVGERLDTLCTLVALAGGLLLLALIGVECVSVVGRSLPELLGWTGLGWRPRSVPGDAEIAQALTATSLFSFLPYCQMRAGHIRVEVFSTYFPEGLNAALDRLWSVVFAVLAAVLAWRLMLGWLNKWANGDSTMVLRIPEAVPFGAAVVCSLLLLAAIVQGVLARPVPVLSPAH